MVIFFSTWAISLALIYYRISGIQGASFDLRFRNYMYRVFFFKFKPWCGSDAINAYTFAPVLFGGHHADLWYTDHRADLICSWNFKPTSLIQCPSTLRLRDYHAKLYTRSSRWHTRTFKPNISPGCFSRLSRRRALTLIFAHNEAHQLSLALPEVITLTYAHFELLFFRFFD